jgi:BSD domain
MNSEEGEEDSEEFPWVEIIHWALENSVEPNQVLAYDLDLVKSEILRLTNSEQNVSDSILKDRSNSDSLVKINSYEDGSVEDWEEWAESLLVKIPSLRIARYRLVPAKISESKFWSNYFSSIKLAVFNAVSIKIKTSE